MSKLSNKMNDDMLLYGFSQNTRKVYINPKFPLQMIPTQAQ